ncbi:hypothetical protein [Nocardioides pakistanensis]
MPCPTLTDAECREIIPALKNLRRVEEDEDWSTPEGYDDSPDQGVHRFDGGGAW